MVTIPRSVFLQFVAFFEAKTNRKFKGSFAIRNAKLAKDTMGDHYAIGFNGQFFHTIRVSPELNGPFGICDTIFHELVHAQQTELFGIPEFSKSYIASNESLGYWNNTFEVDARESADLLVRQFFKEYIPGQVNNKMYITKITW